MVPDRKAQQLPDAWVDDRSGPALICVPWHGRAVARLVPNSGGVPIAQAAAERIRARAQSLKAVGFKWDDLKALQPQAAPSGPATRPPGHGTGYPAELADLTCRTARKTAQM